MYINIFHSVPLLQYYTRRVQPYTLLRSSNSSYLALAMQVFQSAQLLRRIKNVCLCRIEPNTSLAYGNDVSEVALYEAEAMAANISPML